MAKTVSMAGLHPEELSLVRMLVGLLRDPDPMVAELAQQALIYVRDTSAGKSAERLA